MNQEQKEQMAKPLDKEAFIKEALEDLVEVSRQAERGDVLKDKINKQLKVAFGVVEAYGEQCRTEGEQDILNDLEAHKLRAKKRFPNHTRAIEIWSNDYLAALKMLVRDLKEQSNDNKVVEDSFNAGEKKVNL